MDQEKSPIIMEYEKNYKKRTSRNLSENPIELNNVSANSNRTYQNHKSKITKINDE